MIQFTIERRKSLSDIAPKYNITLQEWNHEQDHIHILFKGHPNSELSKFINAYKSASSRLLKKEFPDIRKKLWKEYFWSRSFCLLTTGGARIEIIKNTSNHKDRKRGETMLRAKKVYLCASPSDMDRLFACNRESALVWNHCLQLSRQYYRDNGKWITKSELQKATKGKFHLHSQSIQAVCHKYLFARESAHQAIQKEIKTARYPYKNKAHYNTKWAKDGFQIDGNGEMELSMGIHGGKREKPIVVYTKNLPQGKIKEIELCYDHGLYLSVAFEDGKENQPYEKKQSSGVDLGEIHTIAAFAESGEALIITGRKVRSIHRLRNKKLAEIQRLQSKCNKGSRQWKKYQKAKRYLLSKFEKQLEDALHKTTKQFVDWRVKQSVSDVHIGNPEGVQRKTRKKKKVTRKQAQRLSNWSFGKVKKYLQYKLAMMGIQLHQVDESYTSQTCPVCKRRQRVSFRNYRCSCGYKEHRDTHGARNILAKSLYGEIQHLDVSTKQTYLRIA